MGRSRRKSRGKLDRKSVLTFAGLGSLAVATLAVVGMALAGTQAATVSPVAAPRPTFTERTIVPMVSVLGDSYTGGSDVGGIKDKGWPALTKQALLDSGKDTDMRVSGRGGSGYVHLGGEGTTFVTEVPKVVFPESDVVVFFGSRNDMGNSPVEVQAAAATAYAEARKIAPSAKLIVVGVPWTNEKLPANVVRTNQAVSAAANEAGAIFIDPQAEGWFFGTNAALIGLDKVHPTDEGHMYLSKLIAPHIQAALT